MSVVAFPGESAIVVRGVASNDHDIFTDSLQVSVARPDGSAHPLRMGSVGAGTSSEEVAEMIADAINSGTTVDASVTREPDGTHRVQLGTQKRLKAFAVVDPSLQVEARTSQTPGHIGDFVFTGEYTPMFYDLIRLLVPQDG
jgi:hypothetical protein